jgi:hypothetical protein
MKKPKLINLLFCLVVSTLILVQVTFGGITGCNQGLLSDHIFNNGVSGIVTGENELPIYENPALLGSTLEGSLKYTFSIAGENNIVNSIVYCPQNKSGSFSLLYDNYNRVIKRISDDYGRLEFDSELRIP